MKLYDLEVLMSKGKARCFQCKAILDTNDPTTYIMLKFFNGDGYDIQCRDCHNNGKRKYE